MARSPPPPFTATTQRKYRMQHNRFHRRASLSSDESTNNNLKLKRWDKIKLKGPNPKGLGDEIRRREAVIVFTPRGLEPTTAELRKLPRHGCKDRRRRICESLHLPETENAQLNRPILPANASWLQNHNHGGWWLTRAPTDGNRRREEDTTTDDLIWRKKGLRRRHGRSRADRPPDPQSFSLTFSL